MNLFDKWGLPRTASLRDITRAYRKRAQVLHPDKPTGNQELFCVLQEEYVLLKDPGFRADGGDIPEPQPETAPPPPDPPKKMEELGPLAPLGVTVQVPLKHIATGCIVPVRVLVAQECCGRASCSICQGTGERPLVRTVRVTVPQGAVPGQVIVVPKEGHLRQDQQGDVRITVVWSHTYGWHYDFGMTKTVMLPLGWNEPVWLRAPNGNIGSFPLASPLVSPLKIGLIVPWPTQVIVRVVPVGGVRAWWAKSKQQGLAWRAKLRKIWAI